jgi:spore coat polysaccharide biosynthesis protein SpsF
LKNFNNHKTLKVIIGIQARLNSTRLPNKVLRVIGEETIIQHINNISCDVKSVAESYILTGSVENNKELIDYCSNLKIPILSGDENNVLSRYVSLQKKTDADILVRLTGDNPLVQANLIDRIVDEFTTKPDLDYVSNCLYQDYPLGLNVEAFTKNGLGKLMQNPTPSDLEHVTASFRLHKEKFKTYHVSAPPELHWPELRLTIDEELDFIFIDNIYKILGEKMWDIFYLLKFLKSNPNYVINSQIRQKGF